MGGVVFLNKTLGLPHKNVEKQPVGDAGSSAAGRGTATAREHPSGLGPLPGAVS